MQELNLNNPDFRKNYTKLHALEKVEFYRSLDEGQRQKIYELLDPEEYAEVFQELEPKEQRLFFLELNRSYAVNMLQQMFSDDAAAFLNSISEETADAFLQLMLKDNAEDVEQIMSYPEETAGARMTTEFISVSSQDTVSQVLDHLRKAGHEAETIYYLYVVDSQERLVGVLSLRELIVAPLDIPIEDLMSTRVVSVSVDTDQEEAAGLIKRYDFLALPVVSRYGRLVGILTVDDVMDVLEEETTEDFENISAAKGVVDLDMGSMEAAKKRLPWLIILLLLGMLTAGLISWFEQTLEEVAVLAIFIPLIAGMAGNTGTQSLAIVVRSMALGKLDRQAVEKLIKREWGSGLLMGVVCGCTVALISQVLTSGNLILGLVVGLSLFCTIAVATIAGAIVPLIIHRFRIDPAVASGPFITTINDILGLSIYFSIATILLT